MSGTVLYVVDMQPGFNASLRILDETIREINLAKRRRDHIVFVELVPESNRATHGQLLEAAGHGGYDKISRITKLRGDGSVEFLAEAEKVEFQYKRVRVCGVNRHACVRNTIDGLRERLPKNIGIEIACAATADSCGKEWDERNDRYYIQLAEQGEIKLK